MIDALLYSVFGSGGASHVTKPPVRDYRNAWISGILTPGTVQAVVTFGHHGEDGVDRVHERPRRPGRPGR